MRVIATKTGFDASSTLRHPGEEFEMPEKSKGSWFEPVAKSKGKAEGKSEGKSEGKDDGADLT